MDQLVDSVRKYLAKDWGQVLLTAIGLLIVLTFIGAPRAVSEMIGLAIEAFSPYNHRNGLAFFFLLVGVPTGLLAKNWRTAALLIVCGAAITLLGDLHSTDSPEKSGQLIISLTLSIAVIASATRWLFQNIKPDLAAYDENQGFIDILRSRITIGLAIVAGLFGLGQFSSHEVADESAYYDAATEASEAIEEAEAAAAGSVYPPFDPVAAYDVEKAAEAAAQGVEAVAEAADEAGAELPDFDMSLGTPSASEEFYNRIAEDGRKSAERQRQPVEGQAGAEVTTSSKPSFDCTKHLGRVEQMICRNPSLAGADVQLDTAFKKKLDGTKGTERSAILTMQRLALKERNACPTFECVSKWYSSELSRY